MFTLCMNDHHYFELIVPWISYKCLPIALNRRTSEMIGIKRQAIHSKIEELYLDIYIHTGYPCFRYCICKFFNKDDKKNALAENYYN